MKLLPRHSGTRLVLLLLLFTCAVAVGRAIIGRLHNWSTPVQTQPVDRP